MTESNDPSGELERLAALEARLQGALAKALKRAVADDPAWDRFEKAAGLNPETQNGTSSSESDDPRPDAGGS